MRLISRPEQAERNAKIFTACLEGSTFQKIAKAHGMKGQRVEQIFRSEGKRRFPGIYVTIQGGHGFRGRFLAALKNAGLLA